MLGYNSVAANKSKYISSNQTSAQWNNKQENKHIQVAFRTASESKVVINNRHTNTLEMRTRQYNAVTVP